MRLVTTFSAESSAAIFGGNIKVWTHETYLVVFFLCRRSSQLTELVEKKTGPKAAELLFLEGCCLQLFLLLSRLRKRMHHRHHHRPPYC